jgi:hypothetical protein
MQATLEPRWKCGECGWVHDSEDDANDCCRPIIIEGWECPICRKFFEDDKEAIACCGYDPDGPPPPPTKEELEEAGQQRLVLRM